MRSTRIKRAMTIRLNESSYQWLEKQANENGVLASRYVATMVEEIVHRYKQYEKDMEEWLNA